MKILYSNLSVLIIKLSIQLINMYDLNLINLFQKITSYKCKKMNHFLLNYQVMKKTHMKFLLHLYNHQMLFIMMKLLLYNL